ncbi:hypothetical protein Q644_25620 [Brucella intermedia 229E]|uniref:Uncharacterized protein n=1 Tax=Brucella intermedia 229E TaxID=1337887 RepID=U4V7H8_9HYPH|nr:hypothetical protein Q644_25620 [Brucella intermedia 229E]
MFRFYETGTAGRSAFSALTSSGNSEAGKTMGEIEHKCGHFPNHYTIMIHLAAGRYQPVSNGRRTLAGRIFFQSIPARSAISCEWSRRTRAADMPGQQKLLSSRVFE